MIRALVAPRRYVQGAGALAEAGRWIGPIGRRALVVWGGRTRAAVGDALAESLGAAGIECISFGFGGESTRAEAQKGVDLARQDGATVVVGVGGGKALDTARAVAATAGMPVVAVPTIASNDSPTSACTVYYTDEGVLDGWDVWPNNPDLVLVDTQVIADAPARWLVSGMGDALATWFEAEAAYRGRRVAFSGGLPTRAALALARLCHETLIECGIDALRDASCHAVTPALERIVEANILLSGLGWESGGLATAHTLGNGLTAIPGTHGRSHGEKVAFGLATQLCLDEDVPAADRNAAFGFMVAVGLPVTFEEVGLSGLDDAGLRGLAEMLAAPGQLLHNHVFPVSPGDLLGAMRAADALGRHLRQG